MADNFTRATEALTSATEARAALQLVLSTDPDPDLASERAARLRSIERLSSRVHSDMKTAQVNALVSIADSLRTLALTR